MTKKTTKTPDFRVINLKMDTGKTIFDAKSGKGSEGVFIEPSP